MCIYSSDFNNNLLREGQKRSGTFKKKLVNLRDVWETDVLTFSNYYNFCLKHGTMNKRFSMVQWLRHHTRNQEP